MTAIVTGATGFIGRQLVKALASSGEEVRCLTRGRPPADSRANVLFHQTDYARPDLGLTEEKLRGAGTIYHLAGATRAVSSADFSAANFAVTERLLDRVVALGEKPRFVLVSSQAAAGPAPDADHPKREGDAEAPIEDYGRSKLAAERAVRARRDALPTTIVRPVAVYGPGDRDFLSIFAMAKRGIAIYPGVRHSILNTVYVADLVAGMIAAARSPAAARGTYFLGDDTPRPWTEIYTAIATAVGQGTALELSVPRSVISAAGVLGDLVGSVVGKPSLVGKSKAALAVPKYWLCSSDRARRDFGFVTPTSLGDGMRTTYDWYVQHRWL
jgi:nucleoside-diphosphate-sugar epimerase